MARLIDADELEKEMYHEAFETDSDMQKWDGGCWIRYKMFENCIEKAPTVDAAPVVHGKWVDMRESYNDVPNVKCSACGEVWYGLETNYCPNCGAKMDGGIGTAEDICKTTNIPCIKCNPGPCEHRKKG